MVGTTAVPLGAPARALEMSGGGASGTLPLAMLLLQLLLSVLVLNCVLSKSFPSVLSLCFLLRYFYCGREGRQWNLME